MAKPEVLNLTNEFDPAAASTADVGTFSTSSTSDLVTDANTSLESDLEFQDWGLIDYQEALERQLALVEQVAIGAHPGALVFCSHPAVVTLGRATQDGELYAWNGPVVEIARGGRSTYHGPSQLVVYPIMSLRVARKGRGKQEIAGYLRALEDGLIEWLARHGVAADGRSLKKKSPGEVASEETGVWVGDRKIASLGIGVKKWTTFHGAALNLDQDPQAFFGMNPCGFRREVMMSLQEILARPIDREAAKAELREILLRRL